MQISQICWVSDLFDSLIHLLIFLNDGSELLVSIYDLLLSRSELLVCGLILQRVRDWMRLQRHRPRIMSVEQFIYLRFEVFDGCRQEHILIIHHAVLHPVLNLYSIIQSI